MLVYINDVWKGQSVRVWCGSAMLVYVLVLVFGAADMSLVLFHRVELDIAHGTWVALYCGGKSVSHHFCCFSTRILHTRNFQQYWKLSLEYIYGREQNNPYVFITTFSHETRLLARIVIAANDTPFIPVVKRQLDSRPVQVRGITISSLKAHMWTYHLGSKPYYPY